MEITIRIADSFIPERTYVIEFLFVSLLGQQVNIKTDPDSVGYTIGLPDGEAFFADQFFTLFQNAEPQYTKDLIPDSVQYLNCSFYGNKDLPVLYGGGSLKTKSQRIEFDSDIFASTFFMLSRWEESVCEGHDEHGRTRTTELLACREGFYDRPVVNEYAELLWNVITSLGYMGTRIGGGFKIIPTHDIDFFYKWEGPMDAVKSAAGDLLKRRNLKLAGKSLGDYRSMKQGKRKDPYQTFERLITEAKRKGLSPRFYIMAGGDSPNDADYSLSDTEVVTLLNKLKDNYIPIGLHPSYESCVRPELFSNEKAELEKNAGVEVTSSRQHFLRYNILTTFRELNSAGITHDSSMGFSDRAGFRCGTAMPFQIFDLEGRSSLDIVEHPFVIMDMALLRKHKNNAEEAIEEVKKVVSQCRKFEMPCVFIWHNSSFYGKEWEGYETVFQKLMDLS